MHEKLDLKMETNEVTVQYFYKLQNRVTNFKFNIKVKLDIKCRNFSTHIIKSMLFINFLINC